MTEVQIRKLNTQDFWRILQIIRKGGKEAFARLDKDLPESEAGMAIFDIGMEYAERELQQFLASVANMELEEYRAGDFDLTLRILEQLNEEEKLGNFFKRAAKFVKSFR